MKRMLLLCLGFILQQNAAWGECRYPCDAGDGTHTVSFPIQSNNANTAVIGLDPDKHYLGIDAVRWFINDQSNILKDKMGTGTVRISIGNESYEVSLATYQLSSGERTAPVFDKPLIQNRLYQKGDIKIQLFVQLVKEDTAVASLLKEVANASLGFAATAVSTATLTGPWPAIAPGGKALITGVEKYMNAADGKKSLFDPNGIDATLKVKQINGDETYVLYHRGIPLDSSKLTLNTTANGQVSLLYRGKSLNDGVWMLFRLRREIAYGYARPWDDHARKVTDQLDGLMDQWRISGSSFNQQVKAELPKHMESIGNLMFLIREDHVLSKAEVKLENLRLAKLAGYAQAAVDEGKPDSYYKNRDELRNILLANIPAPSGFMDMFFGEKGTQVFSRFDDDSIKDRPGKLTLDDMRAIAKKKGQRWWEKSKN